jgi:hypothetical protein
MTDAMMERIDRLYELLPVVYRQRDLVQGLPLRDLLRAIAEQVNLIEDDIAGMYEDWFIETCQDWVVPYIADLIGYQVVHAGVIEANDAEARLRTRSLVPRRDVANHIRDLRRRGTLALLENLAADSAGFPCRAGEFYRLLGRTQSLNHLNHRGRLANLRDGEALDLIDSPFDRIAHTVDVRNVNARRNPGRHNIPNVGAYVWRLRAYPVTKAPAAFLQQRSTGYAFYTFSSLGNDAPLFSSAQRETDPTTIAKEINLPVPIRRRALELHRDDYYGPSKSFAIWLNDAEEPVPAEKIVAADLTSWKYRPVGDQVVVDPQLGRIVLAQEADAIRVSYRYGFSDDVGAHESARTLTQPRDKVILNDQVQYTKLYRVGAIEEFAKVSLALAQWKTDAPVNAVIEIADNDAYTEAFEIELPAKTTLQLRAANRCRPLLRVLDYGVSQGERLHVLMHDRSRFTLDGIMLAGRPLRIEGAGDQPADVRVAIRRCTLVPGWDLNHNCTPSSPGEASVELDNVRGTVTIDRSIVGTIAVVDDTAKEEPIDVEIRDSIVDATSRDLEAVTGPNAGYAWASLTVVRSTVIGQVLAHAMELGEDSIFDGVVHVVRRQRGCVRFCYVRPESRTPRHYHCQPDLAVQAVPASRAEEERRRVAPRFTSTRFSDPGYCQLALDCAAEIARGAEDESEMGAFHDLFTPQRAANLRARLDQSTPAGMETGIIYAD